MSIGAEVENSPVGVALSVNNVQISVKETAIVGAMVLPEEYIEIDGLIDVRPGDDVSVNCPSLLSVVKGAVGFDELLLGLKGLVYVNE